MLMTLLALLGLAATPTAQDPCRSPQWMSSARVAMSCDFADAAAAARRGADEFVGRRTRTAFIITTALSGAHASLVLSDRRATAKTASAQATELGAEGGWIGADGEIRSGSGAWTADLRAWGYDIDDVAPGTLVEIVTGAPRQTQEKNHGNF